MFCFYSPMTDQQSPPKRKLNFDGMKRVEYVHNEASTDKNSGEVSGIFTSLSIFPFNCFTSFITLFSLFLICTCLYVPHTFYFVVHLIPSYLLLCIVFVWDVYLHH